MAVVKPHPVRVGRMGAKHARGSGFLIVCPSIFWHLNSGSVIDDSLQHFVLHVSMYRPWKKGIPIESIPNIHLRRNSSNNTCVGFDIHVNPRGWGCYSDNCTLM
jgi:hypothetical protein